MAENSGCPDKLISDLLQDDPDLIDIVEEFVEGLDGRIDELQAAFRTQDWEMMTTLAHRLKGAGGSYGYPDISSLGATMEHEFKAHSASDFDAWMNQLGALTRAAQAGLAECG